MHSGEPPRSGLKLSHTAALTVHWGKAVYRDLCAQEYVNRLDLSEGQELLESCNAICPWYSELIINRKFYIRKLLEQFYKRSQEHFQLLILAAGADPLALEALHKYGDRLDNVIEVDLMDHSAKQYIYGDVAPDLMKNIHFVQGDVRDNDLFKRLEFFAGYDRQKPAFIVAEGLSYFLAKPELQLLFQELHSKNKMHTLVMDFLLAEEHIGRDYASIPRQIIETVMNYIGSDESNSSYLAYTVDEIADLFEACDCYTSCFYPQSIMEHCRKGIYAYFHPDNDGWVALASGSI